MCYTYCGMGPPFLKSYLEDTVILTFECRAFGEGAITIYCKRLGFDAAGTSRAGDLTRRARAGLEFHDLPDALLLGFRNRSLLLTLLE
jgi:hypothetical protein